MSICMEGLTEYEKNCYDSFIGGHVCPDRKMHDRVEFETTMWGSSSSGIGPNLYVECLRCGCQQDITDYGSW